MDAIVVLFITLAIAVINNSSAVVSRGGKLKTLIQKEFWRYHNLVILSRIVKTRLPWYRTQYRTGYRTSRFKSATGGYGDRTGGAGNGFICENSTSAEGKRNR
jgi:hypothetical protein